MLRLSSFFDEMNGLVEMQVSSVESRGVVNDYFLILNAEDDSLVDIVLLSLVIEDSHLGHEVNSGHQQWLRVLTLWSSTPKS